MKILDNANSANSRALGILKLNEIFSDFTFFGHERTKPSMFFTSVSKAFGKAKECFQNFVSTTENLIQWALGNLDSFQSFLGIFRLTFFPKFDSSGLCWRVAKYLFRFFSNSEDNFIQNIGKISNPSQIWITYRLRDAFEELHEFFQTFSRNFCFNLRVELVV